MTNKKVLVTGAGGFIGSHLTERLSASGYAVKAFVHYNSGNSWGWLDSSKCKESIEIISGDIRDADIVRDAMREVDEVFHLAALVGIPYSYHSPEAYVETNIKGTLNILQAAKEMGVKKVIQTSTSEIYGTAQFVPISESHPVSPQSPYAATKAAADFLALSFHRSFDLPVVVIRPFNTYGPRQSCRAIVPTIVTQVLEGKKELRLGSLHPSRDLAYVDDTVNGFIKAAASDKGIGEVINLGTGSEVSIGELAKLIAGILGSKVKVVSDEKRKRPEKSEVERLLSDNRKAAKLLGWKPEISLEDGIRKTAEWFSKKDNLKKYKSGIYNI